MNKTRGPRWFKVFLDVGNLIERVDDASLGRGVKAIFHYARTGEYPQIDDPFAYGVFTLLKRGVDETIESYMKAVSGGKKSAKLRRDRLNKIWPER